MKTVKVRTLFFGFTAQMGIRTNSMRFPGEERGPETDPTLRPEAAAENHIDVQPFSIADPLSSPKLSPATSK